ncbi:dynamin-related GTPase [Pichia kluyveri]|uniref:dynamin GTPase n=1 Tax=Pichia kluyveri TaxID=36015 RepID=A0AAV5QWD8_PICKL|nr:dynamin-related GTPase [Pichia kluyveri]
MASLHDLIPIVNKLQDIVTNTSLTDLDLPLLTVIGSQSAGKSSVLENIVGKDFLPRGTGIVTRRPLILQLIHVAANDPLLHKSDFISDEAPIDPNEMTLEQHLRNHNSSSNVNEIPPSTPAEEWGEFLHIPGKRFYNFENIRKEIENETSRIAGINKGISRIPINLKIYSPNVLNLTLVDLPGLTKIPIADQPVDIERQIKNLLLEYISKPNSIILAVTPANQDLVNSEALKLARQVDPQGKRTIGILSKLDLMDHGTNALDILTGKVYPLKLGFIGVVNRSQQDINQRKSLDESLAAEMEFFNSHPAYKTISNRCGTEYLAKTLNKTLMNHIRERLPDIKAKLNTLMGQTEQELASYGNLNIISKENRGGLILQLMNKFANNFINSIEGNSSEISTKELCGGARIYYIYNEVLGNSMMSINPLQNLTVIDIRTAIRNSTGPRPSLFVPELAFDLLVKPQIQLLEGPSHRCVELVYEELMKICHNCGSQELARYPKLHTKLIEVVSELLRERLGPTTKYVESLIEINRAYINTNHPNFVGAANAMAEVAEERQKQKQNEKIKLLKKEEESIHIQQQTAHSRTESQSSGSGNGRIAKAAASAAASHLHNELKESSILSELKENHTANGTTDSTSGSKPEKENFLNYFFGKKDKSHPTESDNKIAPFSYPTETESSQLQFHLPVESSIQNQLEQFHLSEEQLSEREQLECELIRRLIASYFSIVRETIRDQVPKAIMCLLVNYSKDSVQNQLVQKLYKESLFDDLLYEDETLIQEREKCEKLLDTYKEAAKVISEVM